MRADLGAPAAAALWARYAQPHRVYHTGIHLAEAWTALQQVTGGAPAPAARLALWFHDAVYDPRRDDNEAASARLAVAELTSARTPPRSAALVAQVERLVLATAAHVAEPDDTGDQSAAAALLDADLWILAAPRARYEECALQVRREYAHVGDELFAAGRSAILRDLLAREHLYATPVGRSWAAAARANMARELTRYPDTGPHA